MEKPKRNTAVDIAKAIGIILVVYGHVMRGLYHSGVISSSQSFSFIDSVIYSFHMPLFFFLSGLFFYSALIKSGGKRFLLYKVDSVVYPYFLWSIVQGLLELSASNYTNNPIHISDILALIWAPRAQFWFLYALFFIFIVSVILNTIFKKYFSVSVIIFSLFAYYVAIEFQLPGILNIVLLNIVFFSFGICFSLFDGLNKLGSLPCTIFLSLAFIAAQYYFHLTLNLHYYDRGITSLSLAIISIIFVLSLSKTINELFKNTQLLQLVGSASLVIFLLHVIVASGTRILLQKGFGINTLEIHVIMGTFLGLFVPMCVAQKAKHSSLSYLFRAPISQIITKKAREF